MTEYDYSPDAWERYIAKQNEIAGWAKETCPYPQLCNPFLPATPHLKFREMKEEQKKLKEEKKERPPRDRRHSYDVRPRHRSEVDDAGRDSSRPSKPRKTSDSHISSRKREPSSRDLPKDAATTHQSSRQKDLSEEDYKDGDRRYRKSKSSTSQVSSREDTTSRDRDKRRSERRSSAQSSRPREPVAVRGEGYVLVHKDKSRTTHDTPTSTRVSTPTGTSRRRTSSPHTEAKPPRNHRSHTIPNLALDLPPPGQYHDPNQLYHPRSSGTPPNGYYIPQYRPQTPPNSAPPMVSAKSPQAVRSQTMPAYALARDFDPAPVPQLPFSAYAPSPSKNSTSTSLLKRMFNGLAINKSSTSKQGTKPRDECASSSGRRILRKRSSF